MSTQKIYLIIFLIFASFFASGQSFVQNVTITGTANGNPQKLVRVIVYADQFSMLEKTIASTYSDEAGNFKLSFEMDHIDYAFLAYDIKRGEFYLSPDGSYQFTIFDDTVSERGSIFDELPLQFSYEVDDKGFSDDIADFNIHYNNFLFKNGNKIYRGRDKQIIKDFETKTNEIFKGKGNTYFQNYVEYSLGWLEWISKTKNDSLVLDTYFINRPILYNNIQYTEFLKEFSKSYFGYNRLIGYDELVKAINYGDGFDQIQRLVNRDKNLSKDDQLSELFAILVLARKYYSSDIIKEKAIAKLNELAKTSTYPFHRVIAKNYIKKLTDLATDTKAPDFKLKNQFGETLTLDDFAGKMTLLSFVKTDCKICEEHFQLLQEIAKSLNQKLQLVTIVYGDDYGDMVKYASSRSYDWPFLKLNNDILLLEAYNIRAYPSYVIIYPDGTLAMATAPMPDENLDLYIQRHLNRFEEMKGAR